MSLVRIFVAGVLLALAASVSCVTRSVPAPRNLIVISIDTLRADHLGCYGYERPTSPVIDAFASRGVLFADAAATSPWTLPSHGSLLTGLYPVRHGAHTAKTSVSEQVETLAEWLGGKGFATAAVVNSTYLTRWGLQRGFESFFHVRESVRDREPSEVTDEALSWLSGHDRDSRRFFLFLHYYDVHSDYASLPEYERTFAAAYDGPADGTTAQMLDHRNGKIRLRQEDADHLRDLYDGGILQLDHQLDRLFRGLDALGITEQSLIVLTSDHGEEFLEHGGVLHGLTQYQEVLAVPLIVGGPGVPAGRRIATPASLIDVMPTALEVLEVPIPPELDGISLVATWNVPQAGVPGRVLFSEADFAFDPETRVKALGSKRTARDERYRLHYDVATGLRQLFDLSHDPLEQHDVLVDRKGEAAALFDQLEVFLRQDPVYAETPQLSADELDRLRSLGYAQ